MLENLKENLKGFFHNEHGELIAQREAEKTEYEQSDCRYAAEIEHLQSKPLSCLRDIDETRAQIEKIKKARDKAKTDFQIRSSQLVGQIRAAAPKQIDAAIRRLQAERERTAGALSVRGRIERNAAGMESGYIDSNSPKIQARLSAIDAAYREIESLKLSGDIKRIAEIEANVPPFDDETERFETSAAVARGLQQSPSTSF